MTNALLLSKQGIFYDMKYKIFFLLASLLFCSTLHAVDHYLEQLQEKATKENLWQQQSWLNLLHYRESSQFWEPSFKSSIDHVPFFLSVVGHQSPQLELQATLTFLFDTEKSNNKHVQCQFIGRFNWLSEQLNIDKKRLPAVNCKDYKKWREQVHAEKVTLVFPAYYLNSPSSMFGHTLLRLDPKEDENWSNWLSFAVNFGANVNDSDNSIMYAYKGLMGGYPGQFAVVPYYEKILEYSRMERRDIWEYELSLTPKEVNRLAEHLWELNGVNFDYYFFTENCSFRLLELLEVARPGINLTEEFSLTAIPVDTVRAVERIGLIKKARYRPSHEAVLQKMINGLNPAERSTLRQLASQPNKTLLSSLSPERQQLVVETAYKLLRFRQNKQARDETIAKKSYQLLALMNHYPVKVHEPVTPPVQPEKSHGSKQIAFKIGERNNKSYTELAFRMAFHGLEDNELGFLRGAQINIASGRFRRSEKGTIFLQQLDIVDIFSLTPRTDFFKPLSWRIKSGAERVYREGHDRLVTHISGGVGSSWNISENTTAYSLLTSRFEGGSHFKHYIEPSLGAIGGLLMHHKIGTGKLEFSSEKFLGGIQASDLEYEQNLVLSKDHAIKLSLKREWVQDKALTEFGVSYQLYF